MAKKKRGRVKKEGKSEAGAPHIAEAIPQKSRSRIKKENFSEEDPDIDEEEEEINMSRVAPVKIKKEEATSADGTNLDTLAPKKARVRAKKATRVKAEVIDKEGSEDSIQESSEVNEVVKAKSGRKKKKASIEGPAMSVEVSNVIEATPNISTRITRSRAK